MSEKFKKPPTQGELSKHFKAESMELHEIALEKLRKRLKNNEITMKEFQIEVNKLNEFFS